LLDTDQPTHIAVVWDTYAPTFRHQMDPNYKAHRPPQPEEITIAIPYIKKMIQAYGIVNLESDGFEADDIIGTLAKQAEISEADVFLVTPDKDYMQLVDDHICMLKPLNNGDGFEIVNREGVKAYFGVEPEWVIDVLALLGDTSDNVPGVPGIGKKGAPTLVLEYGHIEDLIQKAQDIPQKRTKEALLQSAEQVLKSKTLVTIKTDVPEIPNWRSLEWGGPHTEELAEFFRKMGFRTLHQRFVGQIKKPATATSQGDLFGGDDPQPNQAASNARVTTIREHADDKEYLTILSRTDLEQLVQDLMLKPVICIDTETDSADPMRAKLVGVSISDQADRAWYIPTNQPALATTEVLEVLKPLLEHPTSVKIAHHYKFDYQIFKRHGVTLKGPVFDTMLAAYLIDSGQALKMDALSLKYLDYEPIPIDALIGKQAPWKSMDQVPLETISRYAAEDAEVTYRLYACFQELLQKDALEPVAQTIEFPLSPVLAEMELAGVKIDAALLTHYGQDLLTEITRIESQIYQSAGAQFNINSPAQLGDILFNKLGIPSGKKTSTGKFSTNEEVLTSLSVQYEVPRLVLEYRGLAKLKSTYVDALPELIHPDTGRVHTSFNQHIAATGRLSSSNPNLQNIPIRSDKGREIRKAFIAEPGYQILSADYSQIELRIIASMAHDEAMIRAFEQDEDIHARTASEIFGLQDLSLVTPDQRRKAKEVNFGIPYGVSAFGLAQRLGIPNGEARDMIQAYFDRFPSIKLYMQETVAFAKTHGYVTTLSGRRRYIPEINSNNPAGRGFAERTAINMPIQGTAADLIKIAMISIHRWLQDTQCKSRMIMQVHDELVFEIHDSERDFVPNEIKHRMEHAMDLKVPIKVEMGLASNWLDAH
jgi:DNA polymerase-1